MAVNWIFARPAVAIAILLSACAAAPPGGVVAPGGGTVAGAFLAARYAEAQADPASAAGFYARALAADPANPALTQAAFTTSLLAGSPRAHDLANATPDNVLAMMLRGNDAAGGGNFAQATSLYAQLPDDDLAGLIKPILLAWAQAGAGQGKAGIGLLTPLFNAGPFGPVYALNAALIADLANDTADAAQDYALAGSGQAPNLRLAQILASWQARQGQSQAAAALIDQISATDSDLSLAAPRLRADMADRVIASPADGLAEAYLTLAGSLNQPSQALLQMAFLRFALNLRPDLAAARLLLAAAQSGAGAAPHAPPPSQAALQAALATLQQIPRADPLYGPAALRAAAILVSLHQPDAAVAQLEKLIAAEPGAAGPVETEGDILRDNGEFAAAIVQYDKAIKLAGNPPPPGAWSLLFDRGICEDESGDWAAAEPDLMNALILAPNQPYLLNYIGYSWALRGENLQRAHDMLTQAVGLDPNDGAVIDSLGYVLLRQGHVAEAVSQLTQAVELAPDDAEVNAHLGDAFYAAGERLQADYQWQRALSLKPDAKLQADIEGRLKQLQPPA